MTIFHYLIRYCLIPLLISVSNTTLAAKIIHVKQLNPDASDSGDGSIKKPFLTLNRAISKLQPGDTLIIGKGTYRESIILPERNWPDKTTTSIKANTPDQVLIKGSDIISDWVSMGNDLYTKTNWKINSQQVFIDGNPLQQIGGSVFNNFPNNSKHKAHAYLGKSSIWPGRIKKNRNIIPYNSFYYNQEKHELYIRLANIKNINNHTIEVSTRPFLIYGKYTHGITIDGLHFKHANTSDRSRAGAITLRGNNITLKDIHISEVDSVGLNLSGSNNEVRNSSMNYCGQLGLKVRGKNNTLDNNETNYNNTRGFSKWWEAGGTKFVGEYGLQNSILSNHKAFFNHGDGIWFDWGNKNVEIFNSVSAYNQGFGIHYEAGFAANIHNNLIFANLQRGIYLAHSSNSLIYNNLVALNKMEGIVIIDESRRDKKGILDMEPKHNWIIGNTVAWNSPKKATLILPSLGLENNSNYNLYITNNITPSFSIGWPGALFKRKTIGLKDWQTKIKQDSNSWSINLAAEAAISNAINNRETTINWNHLIGIAKKFPIDNNFLKIIMNKKPNIIINNYPGPKDM